MSSTGDIDGAGMEFAESSIPKLLQRVSAGRPRIATASRNWTCEYDRGAAEREGEDRSLPSLSVDLQWAMTWRGAGVKRGGGQACIVRGLLPSIAIRF